MPSQTIQWFPGHMAKTRRLMKENLALVDIVFELVDARIPQSSRNPEIAQLTEGKPVLTILTKSSLADPAVTKAWMQHYSNQKDGKYVIAIDCVTGEGMNQIEPMVKKALAEKLQRYADKGMAGRRIKAMIVGIPNVGKSSLVNRLSGGKKARVEDRPGVTTNKQWVAMKNGIDLLDMPGVLWPKFDDQRTGENLAVTGAIRDGILDIETLAGILCSRLYENATDLFCTRYKLDKAKLTDAKPHELLEAVARKRGFLISGGELDTERAAIIVLDEFRGAKIGRISLEKPPAEEKKPIEAKAIPAEEKTAERPTEAADAPEEPMIDAAFDQSFRDKGYTLLCGVDEAGRGPLAGPVVAGACILDPAYPIPGLDDSKKLTEKKRDLLFDEITAHALHWGIGTASPEEIDSINILNAALLAMRRAIDAMGVTPDYLLIDGNQTRGFTLPCTAVVHGDATSPSIAAASILAKVTRDRMCTDMEREYPGYGFAGHKGYPTKAHKLAVYRLGPSPIHRKSFLGFLEKDREKLSLWDAEDAETEA